MAFESPQVPQGDPLAVALGFVNWNENWASGTQNFAINSGFIWATAIWLPFGEPVTKLAISIAVAAGGTAITGGFLGLCSPTAMVAQTGNIGTAAASYPLGPLVVPLAGSVTSYTPSRIDSARGLYYVLILLNGTFGTTQPTAYVGATGTGSGANPAGGTQIQWGTAGVGQTVLPANGAAVTLSAGNRAYMVGCA